jgi:universal stress protein A
MAPRLHTFPAPANSGGRERIDPIEEVAMLPIHTILHPTDFSEASKFAFQTASALARDYRARLIVLHVGQLPATPMMEGILADDLEDFEADLQRRLAEVRPTEEGIPLEHKLVLAADTVPEIERIAEEEGCDLIVMGTHGRTGLSRVLMGSVAEAVLRQAPCPVLTVRLPFPRRAEVAPDPEAATVQPAVT